MSSPIEIRVAPVNYWRLALIFIAGPAVLYFLLGYLPTIVWIVFPICIVVLLVRMIMGTPKGPVIVLNEKGVLDRRLKIGVIKWDDIRSIKSYSLSGAEYISLELHDSGKYTARRPFWLGALSQVYRFFGMSTIAISTNGLDVDHASIVYLLHEGCGTEGVEAHTVDIG